MYLDSLGSHNVGQILPGQLRASAGGQEARPLSGFDYRSYQKHSSPPADSKDNGASAAIQEEEGEEERGKK